MRSRTPLVLMEQMVMVLVFALAAALCMQAFVLADRISRETQALDRAVTCAQSAAELWKSCGGDIRAAQGQLGGTVKGGAWTLTYDADWTPLTAAGEAVYQMTLRGTDGEGLREASVEVRKTAQPEPIFSLTLACQEELP